MPLNAMRSAFALICLLLVASTSRADRPVISVFERFYGEAPERDVDDELAPKPSDPLFAGRLLLSELNCTACHRSQRASIGKVAPKTGPVLGAAAARIKPDYLRRYLNNPSEAKPGATMPHVFAGVPEEERKPQIEALVHYLASVAGKPPAQAFPRIGDSEMGGQLYHRVGCAACHGSRREGDPKSSSAKPLGDLNAKYTLPSLSSFLRDPHFVRPSARMPNLNLSGEESRRIAAFLLKLPEFARVKYSYYEGSWQRLPDFSKLEAKAVGGAEEISVKPAKRREQFGLRFEGALMIDTDGEYTFHLRSDDGSRLMIDGKLVVDNDGVHAEQDRSGKAKLTAGPHQVIVDFFEQGGGERVTAQYEGPGVKRGPLSRSMSVGSGGKAKEENLSLEVDPALAARGGKLFGELGCASCHQLKEKGRTVVAVNRAKPLEKLIDGRGCLGTKPSRPAVDYQLTSRMRKELSKALAARRAADRPPLAARDAIAHTMAVFNCYACHRRGEVGGVEIVQDKLFETTTKEMGDEGRIPPSLNGVGAKLTDVWMRRTFSDGADDRPYMLTRMPKFGLAGIGHLGPLLAKTDRSPPRPRPKIEHSLAAIKKAGRRMVGDKGFSCIKCHAFGQYRATGIQSINLRIMPERLRESWFREYMRNPQLFRPRTRMPSAWPTKGPSLLNEILDGDSEQQIQAVWTYLADGKKAKIPSGIEIKSMELLPIDEAIIYRNFIQGAGPRAIAVGYPEGVHLAFDANNLRPAMFWQGRFMDASRHWSGRGQGFQPPAGDKILSFIDGVPIAVLEDEKAPWPTKSARELKYRFRGYRLTKEQRPTFLYAAAGVDVAEFYNMEIEEGGAQAERQLTFSWPASKTPANVWFRLASGKEIRSDGDGSYTIDGNWKTRIGVSGDAKPIIRQTNQRRELLLPITQPGLKVVQQFSW